MKITSKEQLHKELAHAHVGMIEARVAYEKGFYKNTSSKHVARRDMNYKIGHLRDKIQALKLNFRINKSQGAV